MLTSLGIPAALAVVGLVWWAVFSVTWGVGVWIIQRRR